MDRAGRNYIRGAHLSDDFIAEAKERSGEPCRDGDKETGERCEGNFVIVDYL
jgi:hypothetical protein